MKGWTHRPKNDPKWGIKVLGSLTWSIILYLIKTNAKRRKQLKQFFEPGEVKGEVNKKV